MIFVYDFCTYVYGRQLLMYLPRMDAPCGSRGSIKLDSFRFFTRGLTPPTKFQRGLLFISDFLTYSLWSPTNKPVVPFITFHRCNIPVCRTRLWQACHRSRTSTVDFWQITRWQAHGVLRGLIEKDLDKTILEI